MFKLYVHSWSLHNWSNVDSKISPTGRKKKQKKKKQQQKKTSYKHYSLTTPEYVIRK
jgi:predicted  nucleic acid-binding Zn ribbon protein